MRRTLARHTWGPAFLVPFLMAVMTSPDAGIRAESRASHESDGEIPEVTPGAPFTPFERAALKLWSRDIEMYRKFTWDPPEMQDEAAEFMRAVQLQFLPRPRGRDPRITSAMGEKLFEKGCRDPLVRSYYVLALLQEGALRSEAFITQVLKGFDEICYPEEARWVALYSALAVKSSVLFPSNPGNLSGDLVRVVTRRLCDPTLEPLMVRVVFFELRVVLGNSSAPENRTQVEPIYKGCMAVKEKMDPWLQHMITAQYLIDEGWWMRGNRFAQYVSPAAWPIFHEKLVKAKGELLEALKLHPDWVEPAELMIGVAMTGETGDSADEWFEKAVALDPDSLHAYSSYLWALRPRWGGSVEEMYQLAIRAADYRKYDSRVPAFFLTAIEDVEEELHLAQNEVIYEDHPVWRMPGVYERACEILDGMIKHPSRQGEIVLYPTYEVLMTRKFCVACRAGRLQEARQIADQLGGKLSEPVLFTWYQQPARLIAEMYALTGKGAEKIKAARQMLEGVTPPYPNNVLEKAKQLFEEAYAADDHPQSRAYCTVWIRELEGLLAFNAGDWCPLRFDPGFTRWLIIGGVWTYEDENTAVVRANPSYPRTVIRPRASFPWPLEVEFDIQTHEHNHGVFLGLAVPRELNEEFAPTNDDRLGVALPDEIWVTVGKKPICLPSPLFRLNHLKVQLADGYAALWVNGTLMVEVRDPNFRPGPKFDVGALPQLFERSEKGWARLRNVRVRKFEPPKPGEVARAQDIGQAP